MAEADTMKTEQRREAFEKWANSLALSLHRDPFPSKNYTSPATDYAYIGWCAALDSQAAQAQPETALEKFNKNAADLENESPIERLRYFLSHALNGQDWLDVEPFLEAAQAQPSAMQLIEAGWQAALDCHAHYGMAGWSSHRKEYLSKAASPSPNDPPSEGVKTCPECQGSGQWQSACQEMRNCEKCDGRGTIGVRPSDAPSLLTIEEVQQALPDPTSTRREFKGGTTLQMTWHHLNQWAERIQRAVLAKHGIGANHLPGSGGEGGST